MDREEDCISYDPLLQECDLFSLDAEDADDRFAAAYCYHARKASDWVCAVYSFI